MKKLMDERLVDLEPGAEASISGIDENAFDHDRLRELGLNDGTHLRVIKYAPLGDPMEIKIRGYYLSLRKSMASQIRVRRRNRGRHGGRH